MERNGLSRPVAIQVATGQLELDTVLQRMALQARVDSLIRRHELSRALATQIAMGQADLDRVLFKRRMSVHLETHRERSLLTRSVQESLPIHLALHGHKYVEGVVTEVDQYEFVLGGERIHKLQAKWGGVLADKKKGRRALSWDKARKATQEPVWKPQDRYNCSNRRLFGLLDREAQVELSLREGEVFRGQLAWVGRFELGLAVKGKVELTIFRHALENLGEAGG